MEETVRLFIVIQPPGLVTLLLFCTCKQTREDHHGCTHVTISMRNKQQQKKGEYISQLSLNPKIM
jgi:hypothetical protein